MGETFSQLRAPKHEPTEQEIAEQCAAIRAAWSPAERRRRGAWMKSPPVEYGPEQLSDTFREPDAPRVI